MSIPTTAETGTHTIRLTYVNTRLEFDLSRDFHVDVVNDGSWKTHPAIEAMKREFPVVAVLQEGMPCETLGLKRYEGSEDAWMQSTHTVKDRNSDFVNFGRVEHLCIGRFALVGRTLIRFDLGSVPKGTTVGKACLQLYLFARRKPGDIVAYEPLKRWGAGRGPGDRWAKDPVLEGEVSWLCARHPEPWESPGCEAPGKDRVGDPAGTGRIIPERKGWVSIDLAPGLLQRWIEDPSSNRGLLLKDATETDGTEGRYRSNEFGDAAMRPRLVIALVRGK